MKCRMIAILLVEFIAAAVAAQTWTLGPRLNVLRYDLGLVESKDTIYAVGGSIGIPAFDSLAGKALERLDGSAWTKLPSMQKPQRGAAVAAVGGKIYVMGGYGPIDLVQIFDIATRTWQAGPPTPDSLYWATAQAVGDSIYLMGGYSPGTSASERKSVLILNTTSLTWSRGPDLPVGIQNPSSALFGGKIYVFGGWNQDWKLDLSAQRWVLIPGGPADVTHGVAVAAGGNIYIMGGTPGSISGGIKRVLILDPATESWSMGPELLIGLHGAGAVTRDGIIYLAGGRNTNADPTDTTQILDLAKARVSRSVSGPANLTFNTPADTTAVSINLTQVSRTGSIAVIRYAGPPWAVTFSGTPPRNISQYRWVIHRSGIISTLAEIRFAINQIRSGISNLSTVTVYSRPAEGSGPFTALPTSFDAAKRELWVTVSEFSEYIFGSDDNPLVGIDPSAELPGTYILYQNFPNPFNPSTTIGYALPRKSRVILKLFNTLGQVIAELANGDIETGYHEVQFHADNLASGVYFYRLSATPAAPGNGQAGSFVDTKKLLLIH